MVKNWYVKAIDDCIDNSSFLRPNSRLDVVVDSEPYLRRKLVLTRCDILVCR